MEIKEAIRQIRHWRPRTHEEFKKVGVPLEKKALGAGVFREVVKVDGLPLVVKFPLDDAAKGEKPDYRQGIQHSKNEVKKIERLRKMKWMRKYLPRVWYHDAAGGILVMQHYPQFDDLEYEFEEATSEFVKTIFRRATGVRLADYHAGNVRMGRIKNANPHAILIDLGF